MIDKFAIATVSATVIFLANLSLVNSHGRLLEPPSRSSMWRLPEFQHANAPRNDDDNGLNCGGVGAQYNVNGGKCGICGDPYNEPSPRSNEDGGTFGKGIIVRRYEPGQEIPIFVELTAAHKGYFQIRVCPNNPPTEECLDQHVLPFVDTGSTKFHILEDRPGDHMNVSTSVRLPRGITCTKCMVQWHYKAGNSWGVCSEAAQMNGPANRGPPRNETEQDIRGGMGCGQQEWFRACADISIS